MPQPTSTLCTSFLDAYPHPAFVLLPNSRPASENQNLSIVHRNPAFSQLFSSPTTQSDLHDFLVAIRSPTEQYGFERWILRDEPTGTFLFGSNNALGEIPLDVTKTYMNPGIWICTTAPRITVLPVNAEKRQEQTSSNRSITHSPTLNKSLDVHTSAKKLLANYDWSSTLLGPRQKWPQSLASAVNIAMASPHPAAVFWGPELIGIYNDAYTPITGKKFPQLWGKSAISTWSEIWHAIEPKIRAVFAGTPILVEDSLLVIHRLTEDRLPEEAYFTWSYTPVHQADGTVGGYINYVFETTEKIVAQRRMNCLRDLITATIMTASLADFNKSVIHALSNPAYSYDVSFAALYFCTTNDSSISIEGTDSDAQSRVPVVFELGDSIGIPKKHWSVPTSVSIQVNLENLRSRTSSPKTRGSITSKSEFAGFPWPFTEVIEERRVVHMERLRDCLVSNFDRRGWEDRPREAVVIPIGFTDRLLPTAILILGINTRRPYDARYKEDIYIMRMTLSSTLHATLNREVEVKRARQLAELDAAKTAFFDNASHELRTPLTLIGGPLEECINRVEDQSVKKDLQLALRNVNRLRRLVDSLMDFSKLAASKLQGRFKPIKLGMFTGNLATFFREPVEKGNLTYNIHCDDDISQPVCYVDPEFWEQIVFNLIGNAFKYTLQGSITIRFTHTPTNAILIVEDTGPGIPPEDLVKVFQRFHRVQTASRSHEGTGIGLALTKELVTLHGGEISVDSNSNSDGPHGSKFIVTIPLGKNHLPVTQLHEAGLPVTSACTDTHACRWMEEVSTWSGQDLSDNVEQEGKIADVAESRVSRNSWPSELSAMVFTKGDIVLLVDDSADMRQYIKSILSRYCTVFVANNGQEALEKALRIKPNVILSDIMMPIMDGRNLVQQLRCREETKLIPIILVTAKSGNDSRVEGLLSGADDYLTKPFNRSELIARVHLQIQLSKQRVEMERKFLERTLEIQQLSQLSPVAIFRTDQEGRITYVNPRWYKITGHSPYDDVNAWLECIHPEDKEVVSNWWKEACENQAGYTTPVTVDFRWKSLDWCQGQCVTVEKCGLLGAFTDISEHKKIEDIELVHAREREAAARHRAEEAEERRRGQELLIDVTSHELRQPISAILNCSSFVRKSLASLRDMLILPGGISDTTPACLESLEEDLDALDAIYQCGLAQERIANDVLSLSRIQLDVLSIVPVDFELSAELERIVAVFCHETSKKKINLRINFGDSLRLLGVEYICSDKFRFTQVITNLLSNAIKFTDTSSTKREILIEVNAGLQPPTTGTCELPAVPLSAPGSQITPNTALFIYVSVTDSGPGLDPNDLSLLFQRFQQGSNSHKVFGGSGLGLFVSRQLCFLMGGRIDVISSPGQGATFRFFIQVKAASTPVAPPSTTILCTDFCPESRRMHVLITEDNLINQTVLNRQLNKAGFTTVLASNGRQAIDLICSSSKPFDAVLMDVEMPVLDGLCAVREIRHLEAAGKLPKRHRVFALTGNAREGQIQNIRQAGMDDVIIKPYRIDELLAKLWLEN